MKISPFAFATTMLLVASLIRVDAQANLAPPPETAPAPAAANATLPTAGFTADRYAILWTKSPFAVATSESVGEESPDYFLVGVANQEGIFYASVVERQNSEHFLLSSDKPNRGMTLKSIVRTKDGLSTFAEVIKDGQPLTLKLEVAPAGALANGPGAPNMTGNLPLISGGNAVQQQIPMPGAGGGFPNGASVRPFTRFHRPAIHLPPMPQQAPAPAPTPPPQHRNETNPPPPGESFLPPLRYAIIRPENAHGYHFPTFKSLVFACGASSSHARRSGARAGYVAHSGQFRRLPADAGQRDS